MADRLSGADAFIEQLIAAGARYIFGNPGTTEQPFLQRLTDHPQLDLVVALHEGVAVAAAEGYARASGKLGVVQLHAGPGLGNGSGMLYNAAEGNTPLLVYVGQSEQRGLFQEPTLSGDFVAQAASLVKWAAEIRTADEIPAMTRRAIKVATTEPPGPVVLSIPMDLLNEVCSAAVVAPSLVDPRMTPSSASLERAARVIAAARRPVLLVGDAVARAGAVDVVGELAHLIGAPIFGAFMSQTCIDPDHPLNAGRLPSIDVVQARASLDGYDAVVAVGTKVLSNVFTTAGLPLGERPVVHIGLDPWELAKNQPAEVVLGDEALAVQGLIDRVRGLVADRSGQIATLREQAVRRIAAARARALSADRKSWDSSPMTPARALYEIAGRLPSGAAIVDESLTSYAALSRYFRLERDSWFRLRGGGIGAGIPLSIGIQLACPSRPVVAVVGDGASLYSITGLWTAAHHRLPVTWVVLNNASYRTLRENVRREGLDAAAAMRLAGTDLGDPPVNFVSLAGAFGVKAARITDPDDVGPAFAAAVASREPRLLDIAVSAALADR
jgi:benzoylformate decarboxylase